MDDLPVRVEAVGDYVEICRVLRVVASEDRIGHVVRDLDAPERPRGYEEWAVHDVTDCVPLRPK